jgi:hypothetical protein
MTEGRTNGTVFAHAARKGGHFPLSKGHLLVGVLTEAKQALPYCFRIARITDKAAIPFDESSLA